MLMSESSTCSRINSRLATDAQLERSRLAAAGQALIPLVEVRLAMLYHPWSFAALSNSDLGQSTARHSDGQIITYLFLLSQSARLHRNLTRTL